MRKDNIMEDKRQILAFQGLRGFAIILIMLSHCYFKTNIYGTSIMVYAGAIGVYIFILLRVRYLS